MTKKMMLVIALMFLVMGMVLNLILSLIEPFYWMNLTWGAFFLHLGGIFGTLFCLALVRYFFRLVKLVFKKNWFWSFRKLFGAFSLLFRVLSRIILVP